MSFIQIIISVIIGILFTNAIFSSILTIKKIHFRFNLFYLVVITSMIIILVNSLFMLYLETNEQFTFFEKITNQILIIGSFFLFMLVSEVSEYKPKFILYVFLIAVIIFSTANFLKPNGISIDGLVTISKSEIIFGEKVNNYSYEDSIWIYAIIGYLLILIGFVIRAIFFDLVSNKKKKAFLLITSFIPIILVVLIDVLFNNRQSLHSSIHLQISFAIFVIIVGSKNYNDVINSSSIKKALEESESRFRTLFEKSADPMLLIRDDQFVDCNEAAANMLHYNSIENLKKITPDHISPKYQPDGRLSKDKAAELISLTKIKGSHNFEWIHTTKDKKELWIEVTLTQLPVEKHDLIFVSWRNISDRKIAEADLIKEKENAENSEKVKSAFLAQMSHEIRSPLFGILSYISLIKENIQEDQIDKDEMNQYFKTIELSSNRLIRTIDLILNMSELQSASYSPIFNTVDLKILINNLYTEYLEIAHRKGLKLVFKTNTPNTKVTCDEYSVNQIFANLIDNAIKYTEKGIIDIELNINKDSKISVEIVDTGIGMSEDFIKKLFQPFTQEESGYSRKYEGNGLGLALVKNYCEINNIDLEMESQKEKGTKFILVFN